MKTITAMVVAVMVLMCSCGGGSPTPTSSVPQVAGNYTCSNNCTNLCTFGPLTIQQNGSELTATTSSTSCVGTIENNGFFSVSCSGQNPNNDGSCEGTFSGNSLSVDCTFNGTVCQISTYQKQ